MEALLHDIEKAVAAELWLLSVTAILLVPDVAGALAHPSEIAKRSRYVSWWDSTDLKSAYEGYLSAEDAYSYRCSLAHQSSGRRPGPSSDRVLFTPPAAVTVHKIRLERVGSSEGSAVCLDIQAFVADVLAVARHWLETHHDDPVVIKNLQRSVRLHPDGVSPFIVGLPVVG